MRSMLVLALLSASTCVRAGDDEEKREKTRKMAAEVLKDLYKTEPTIEAAFEKAASYAVFANIG